MLLMKPLTGSVILKVVIDNTKNSSMKQSILFLVTFVWTTLCVAQTNERPSWLHVTPHPKNNTYYYRVTHAEGPTYEKAYARAFAMAIMESSWKLGAVVDKKNDLETLEKSITNNINVGDMTMRLPLNKVCEYQEKVSGTMNIRLYILWQVAATGNIEPKFEEYNDCK